MVSGSVKWKGKLKQKQKIHVYLRCCFYLKPTNIYMFVAQNEWF